MIDENGDGFYESSEPIVAGLPDDGGHSTRTIRFGPDGALYVSIGSSCNICQEADPRRATIMRYEADGGNGRIFASGLRNAVGIFFDPTSGLFWATNNGSDGMGDDVPPETLNLVVDGGDYGWPRCHSGDIPDPNFGGEGACDGVTQPVVRMQAHSAPLGLTRMVGSALGPAWDGAMYIAFHGSWNRSIPTGYKVVALPMAGDTPTGEVLDFATDWLLPDGTWWGRPVDVIQAPDGSMLISDDAGGRIFRVFPLQGADED
ncbi:MAG: hypothetical protein DCC58_09690 [Chloroflexi bacterium]|nr:MAG: hypothetical protein DCC58_09690 [Chloroflexota bacterium]